MSQFTIGDGTVFTDVPKTDEYNDVNDFSTVNIEQEIVKTIGEPTDIIRQSLYKTLCINVESIPEPIVTELKESSSEPQPISDKDLNESLLSNEEETKDKKHTNVPKKTQVCPECKKFKCDDEEKMLRHIRKVHRGENPFQCYMCDYSTYNKCLFEEHVRIHQGIKPFKCTHCPHRSASKKNIKKHELIHRPDNPLRCVDCGFIARHCKSLAAHVQSCQTDSTNYDCSQCDFKAESRQALLEHRQLHPPFQVDKLKNKKGKILKEKGKRKLKEKIDFVCKVCSWKSVNNKPKILLHLIHHPNQEVDPAIDISILQKHGIM